jgi:poly-gamma-glutamate synthesis protein (capsule biosynthesis protein)
MRIKIALMTSVVAIAFLLFPVPRSFASVTLLQSPITINFVGDVHGERAINVASLPALRKYFAKGDLNIFNLETAVTDFDQKEVKEYNFKTNFAFLQSLKGVGFNLANIGNNHSYDYGDKGFKDTLKNLDKAGIPYVGGGINKADAYRGKVFEIKGVKIGILGLAKVNGGPESIATAKRAGTTNGYELKATEEAITQLKAQSDLVIVVTHWGEEGSFCPRDSEISSAKKWFSLGADIILGSHTHTLQPVVLKDNKVVAYSMGNFIFYSSRLENRETGILKIEISPKKKISYRIEPFTINNLSKVPEISDRTLREDNSAVTNNKDAILCK